MGIGIIGNRQAKIGNCRRRFFITDLQMHRARATRLGQRQGLLGDGLHILCRQLEGAFGDWLI